MKHRRILRIIAWVCLAALLGGCGKEEDTAAPIGSEVWEEMPTLTYGTLESEKLTVLPWNSGRCEATSSDTMAETELGYYLLNSSPTYLYYADKSNLEHFVIVCNEPECEHMGCDAVFVFGTFVIRDDRIYHTEPSGSIPGPYIKAKGVVLASAKKDGTGTKSAFVIKDAMGSNLVSSMSWLTSQHWLCNAMELNPDGTYTVHAFRVTDDGVEKLATVEDASDENVFIQKVPGFLYGDRLIHNGALDASGHIYFRYHEDSVDTVDLAGMPVTYAYLSGDTLRYLQPNDGYYDMDIRTKETVFLAQPRLENSLAAVVLPNCIVETTLLRSQTLDLRTEGMAHQMAVFDGEAWHDVKLPKELVNAGSQVFVWVQCVSSDKIILYCRDLASYQTVPITNYYYIDLTEDSWELELLTQITDQWYIIEQEGKSRS